jgi:D-alanyl-D-alanine carboxypeptidase/D-alanyl-D-alanine-endopeptidase (penicillin-binding protein 4)
MDHIYANALPITGLVNSNPLAGLDSLAKQIADSGVTEIKGNILIDNRLFDRTPKRDYILSPTMINEGFVDLVIKSTQAGSNATVAMVPENNFYSLKNEVKTVVEGETDVKATLDSKTRVITLMGQIAQSDKEVFRNVNIEQQAVFARAEFIEALKRQGIKLDLENKDTILPLQDKYKNLKPVAILVSPPLSEYAKLILKTSHNPGADLMPLLIAGHFGKKTYEEGLGYIGKFLKENLKLDPDSFVFVHASGGTPLNKVAPEAVIKLLTYIYHQPENNFELFKNALPILGVNGSLFMSGKNSPAKGHLYAKTGTQINYDLTNKRFWYYSEALAGYVMSKNGHIIAFIVDLKNLPMKGINDTFAVQDAVSLVAAEFYQP